MVLAAWVLATELGPAPSEEVTFQVDPPESVEEATSLIWSTITNLVEGFVANLPLIVLGVLVLVLGFAVARLTSNLTQRALRRTAGDPVVVNLGGRLVRLLVLTMFVLLGLSVAGVSVSAALAGLGIAGLAVAFALQSILENFVAGILLIIRKPFVGGDQIIVGDHEGTVEDIDLRVTRIVDYDGETVIIPNAEVFKSPIVNLTRRGKRRTRVVVGIDYRDDHNAAGSLIEDAVAAIDGVLEHPAPQARCVELGDSSVNFEVRYWSAPDIGTVVDVRDRVLRAVKSAIESAGMTIPWPIRTVAMDQPDDWSAADTTSRAPRPRGGSQG